MNCLDLLSYLKNKQTKEKETFPYYLSLCAIIKNEGPYLQEWIEYHKMLGVEQFYLYDNESADNTQEVLEPYIDEGTVKYKFWPGHPVMIEALNDCLKTRKNESFWIGFVDPDEFIVPVKHNSIPEILKEYEEYGGLGINWIVYGSSGHEKKPEGLTIENYTYRSNKNFSINCFVKTITNPRTSAKVFPHNSVYLLKNFPVAIKILLDMEANPKLNKLRFINKILNKIKDISYYAVTENKKKLSSGYSEYNSVDIIRINHYFTRSKEEFIKKSLKGRPDVDKNDSNWLRSMYFFESHDRNEVYDPIMLPYVTKLKEILNTKKELAK
jgi:hypothetical protein